MSKSIVDLNWRYAVKKFDTEKALSDTQIDTVKEAFNLTATSYGLQPIRMVIIKNKSLQEELTKHSFGQKQIEQASHVLVICIENTIDRNYIIKYFENVKRIRNVDDTIIGTFRNELIESFSTKEKIEISDWAKKQAYLAMGNLLTVFANERIDSCPMEGFDSAAYDKILGLTEKGVSSVLVMPIGYRAEDDIFASFKKVRKEIAESIISIS